MSWDCVSKHLGSLEVILNQSPDQSLFVLHVWSSIDNAENDPGDWLWRKKCLHCPDYWCLSASLKGLVLTGATSSLCTGVGIKTISLQSDELLLSSSYLTVVSTITGWILGSILAPCMLFLSPRGVWWRPMVETTPTDQGSLNRTVLCGLPTVDWMTTELDH